VVTHVAALAATCEAEGHTAELWYSCCHAVTQESTTLAALGHDYELTGLDQFAHNVLYVCTHDAAHIKEYKITDALGVKAKTGTWDQIQFGANINVNQLAEVLSEGDTLTYGFYAYPLDKLNTTGQPALGREQDKTLYYGSSSGSAITPLTWDASYATPSVLAEALKAAGFKVYGFDDEAGTLTISLIVTGMASRQTMDLVFRSFVTIVKTDSTVITPPDEWDSSVVKPLGEDTAYPVYSYHIYNSIAKIKEFILNAVGDGLSTLYTPATEAL
jgi:hypothetical protein